MNEAQLAVAVIALLREMGGWGIDVILTSALLVPPVLGFMLITFGIRTIRSLERVMVEGMARTEAISKEMAIRYDNNVILVEDHQKLVRGHQALTDSMLEIIKENTRAITLATARMEGAQGAR